jgi:hypothetical protein
MPDRDSDNVHLKVIRQQALEDLPGASPHPLLPGVESRVVNQFVLDLVKGCIRLEPL